ncbi:MAG: hypothetical protein LBC51_02330 [Treponema sp.]|jgi:hypothetical protein|nr:hypothetical protein [Treponema sp.]
MSVAEKLPFFINALMNMNHKNMKKILFTFLVLIRGASLDALPLDALLLPEQQGALRKAGTLREVQFKRLSPRLMPMHGLIQTLMDEIFETLEPGLLVESLHLYTKPQGAALPQWSRAERSALFNETLALSTLAGLRYFSTSRKAMRVFYESSQVIDGPDTQKPLPDPVYEVPPAKLLLYARQKDLTFGDTIYQYEYHTAEDALVLVQQNLSPLVAGILPAVGKHKLRSVVAVIDTEGFLLIYAASMARVTFLPGMNQRVGQSFATRTDAIMSWFTGRADKAFAH